MKEYINSLKYIMEFGENRGDRTGVGTRSIFSLTQHFDLRDGFPAMTTKKLAFKAVTSELLWFLEGSDDERRLAEILYQKPRGEIVDKQTIWTANANKQGVELGYENTDTVKKLGPIYGVQWKDFGGVDQIEKLVHDLKNDPESRRHLLSAWNVGQINQMALPPCHLLAQFYVSRGTHLNCMTIIRSNDIFLGNPFNIASYALLTHMLAHVTGLQAGELTMQLGDAHIYLNHFDQVKEQVAREPFNRPTLWLNPEIKNIDDFRMEDIRLDGYQSHASIKAPMAA